MLGLAYPIFFCVTALALHHPAFVGDKGGEGQRMSRLYERAFGYRLADLEVLWTGFRDLVERTSWEQLALPSGADVEKVLHILQLDWE